MVCSCAFMACGRSAHSPVLPCDGKAKKKLAQQERALERSYSHMGDLEKSAKQMEELHEAEGARVKATDKEIGVLKDRMFTEGQKLFELRQQEAKEALAAEGAPAAESRWEAQRLSQRVRRRPWAWQRR